MGITGLLPLLSPAKNPIHIKSLAGTTVAIDAYSWLHKGVYGCAMELFLHNNSSSLIEYCRTRIKLLKNFDVTPLMVFDGGHLPVKKEKESERFKFRQSARMEAEKLILEGKKEEAMAQVTKSIDVTPEIANEVIQWLKKENIDFVVAPYEADAQMVYLEKIGKVGAIITEDSDLLVFGANRVIFKLDHAGNGLEICRENIFIPETGFFGYSTKMFQDVCILSGCDYLPSISGIGLKSAQKLMSKHGSVEKIIQSIRLESRKAGLVPETYEEDFQKAYSTFLYQRVFDPAKNCLVTLNPLPSSDKIRDWNFVGPDIEPSLAKDIACGLINPITYLPLKQLYLIQKSSFVKSERLSLPSNTKPITAYFKLKSQNENIVVYEKENKEIKPFELKKPKLEPPKIEPTCPVFEECEEEVSPFFEKFLQSAHVSNVSEITFVPVKLETKAPSEFESITCKKSRQKLMSFTYTKPISAMNPANLKSDHNERTTNTSFPDFLSQFKYKIKD